VHGAAGEFEKSVLSDLHVDQPRLPRVVIDPERFTAPHFLGIVRNWLSDTWHIDSNVIHHHDTTMGVLRRHYLDRQPREESGRKKHCTTAYSLLKMDSSLGATQGQLFLQQLESQNKRGGSM